MQLQQLFDQHQVDASVSGGIVEPRGVRFDLQSQFASQLDKLKSLTEEIKSVLRVPELKLRDQNGRFSLNVDRQKEAPVPLLDLLAILPRQAARTAVVGLAENGAPVLLTLSKEETPHLFIAGGTGAGKSSLLRTIALSLALANRQSQLQMVILDPTFEDEEKRPPSPLARLRYLPHLVLECAHTMSAVEEQLEFLVDEMSYRVEQGIETPPIVLFVDRLARLLERSEGAAANLLMQLAQDGAKAGIHLVVSVEQPASPHISQLFLNNFPLRLVGQTRDEAESISASGTSDSQAHYLLGRGDFLAVSEKQLTHFQAAYINDHDLHLCLERLVRVVRRRLIAQPAEMRNQMPPIGLTNTAVQTPISLSAANRPEVPAAPQSVERERPAVRSRYDFF